MPEFSHLHVHTQFSLLDGAASVTGLMEKAKADNMKAVAITDHGNMFGAFKFVAEANRLGIKPILGCEFYVVEDRFQKSFTQGKRDKRYHQLLLAKDEEGYRNLSKLCSLGYIDGLYSKWPRVDRELIKQHKEGLIATTCCIGAEVPQAIMHGGEEAGEKIFKEWLDIFGDDYYIELQRHHIKDLDGTGWSQEDINQVLIKWSEKYNVPIIATNDSHYVEEEDANAHDILLCVNTGELQTTPIGKGEHYKAKGTRFGFPNQEFFFKTTAQMEQLFSDIPQAVDNTGLIVDKITTPKLTRDVLLPNFTMPQGFANQDDYLRHITYEGARKRYGEITTEIQERLDFELQTISHSGYPGYFLIVQDFTTAARNLGVSVGPGRGSAAGSAVAYCIGITNVDPIKYELLFERFLNPERVSMPDIDIDFDDEGRQKVIDYVVDKYGKNQVAQIITYGSMAAKMSLRDVGRVLDVPLDEVNKICKTFPDHLSATLNKVLPEKGVDEKLKGKFNADQLQSAEEFRKLATDNGQVSKMITEAKKLEGSIRNTGVHACGIIITPDDIKEYIPVATSRDSDLLLTQFDNSVVEKAGLLKMDFLGLKTLTIIKDAVNLIKEIHGVEIDPEAVPLDDEKTFELFQKGKTNGVFQFESPGMKKHLRNLKPDKFEDLIAMNALYRPGPMEYIPNFIARKHGQEEVAYDLPEMEEYLSETYGITVYQEQVMLLSQKMAGFTKGQADSLRKAMGKKIIAMMDELYPLFIDGCKNNGLDEEKVKKVWKDWEAFASYAFNKSHSTCYAFVAFQTAYLKANYPAEYMAAVLTNNMNDIKKVTFFMDECVRLGIPVLEPDVNESAYKFVVNKEGAIRVGLGAIKGVGEAAVESILAEKNENGNYTSIFDLTRRVNLRAANKKSLESLALSGGFDSFQDAHRAQYFHREQEGGSTLLESAIKYGAMFQEQQNSSQQSLFGEDSGVELPEPEIPECKPWDRLFQLAREKEVIGIYISGHPLDDYKTEINHFCNTSLSELKNLEPIKGKEVCFAGVVTNVMHRTTKTGKPYGKLTIEDYSDTHELFIFMPDYVNFKQYMEMGWFLYVKGRVQSRRYDETQLELKISSMDLLSEVKDKLAGSLTIQLGIKDITDEFVEHISTIAEKNKGKCRLKFIVHDQVDGETIDLQMPCKKIHISPTQEFMHALQEQNIRFKFN